MGAISLDTQWLFPYFLCLRDIATEEIIDKAYEIPDLYTIKYRVEMV